MNLRKVLKKSFINQKIYNDINSVLKQYNVVELDEK